MHKDFKKLLGLNINLEYDGNYEKDCKKFKLLKTLAYSLVGIIIIINLIFYFYFNNNVEKTNGTAVVKTPVITSSQQYKTSFNCKKAITYVEQTICSDSSLAKLDIKLAKTYNDKLKNTTSKTKLKQEQKNWVLNIENQCTTKDCISQVILKRIEELSDNTTSDTTNDKATLEKNIVKSIIGGLMNQYQLTNNDLEYMPKENINNIKMFIISIRGSILTLECMKQITKEAPNNYIICMKQHIEKAGVNSEASYKAYQTGEYTTQGKTLEKIPNDDNANELYSMISSDLYNIQKNLSQKANMPQNTYFNLGK